MDNNEIYLFGEVGWEITIQNVIDQIKGTDADKPLIVNIHSNGGSVFEGLAIFNHLKNLGREIHTVSTGLVASIASIIFLAGTKRTLSESSQFLMHLPMTWVDGNSEDIEKGLEQLKVFENQLADIYAAETDISKEEALTLMKEDNFSDIDFLQDKKFVTDVIKLKAVANLNLNNREMSKEETVKIPKKFWAKISEVFNSSGPSAIVVNTADSEKLDFEREEGEPEVGDKATINGEDAEGSYLLPDGRTFVFASGELTAINEKEEGDEGDEGDDAEAKLAQIVSDAVEKALDPVNKALKALEKDNKSHRSILGKMKAVVSDVSVNGKQQASSAAEGSSGVEENPWDSLLEETKN